MDGRFFSLSFCIQPQTHVISVTVQHHFNVLKTSVKLLMSARHQLSQNTELWTCSVLKINAERNKMSKHFFFSLYEGQHFCSTLLSTLASV